MPGRDRGRFPVHADAPPPRKHPVLKHNVDPNRAASYEKAVQPVMAMTEGMAIPPPTPNKTLAAGAVFSFVYAKEVPVSILSCHTNSVD